MRTMTRVTAALALLVTMGVSGQAGAIHFYRGPGGGCTPADGAKGSGGAVPAATVRLLHNTFADDASGTPVTTIRAGQAVRWTWNSVHCHSVSSGAFESGFHYPTPEPGSPRVVPGFFDYPVLEDNPTLSYTVVFDTPGTYTYACVHHGAIGMQGTVVVQ